MYAVSSNVSPRPPLFFTSNSVKFVHMFPFRLQFHFISLHLIPHCETWIPQNRADKDLSLAVNNCRRFGEAYCLHVQGQAVHSYWTVCPWKWRHCSPPPQISHKFLSFDMFYTPVKASFCSIKFPLSLYWIVIVKYERYIHGKKTDVLIRISHGDTGWTMKQLGFGSLQGYSLVGELHLSL